MLHCHTAQLIVQSGTEEEQKKQIRRCQKGKMTIALATLSQSRDRQTFRILKSWRPSLRAHGSHSLNLTNSDMGRRHCLCQHDQHRCSCLRSCRTVCRCCPDLTALGKSSYSISERIKELHIVESTMLVDMDSRV